MQQDVEPGPTRLAEVPEEHRIERPAGGGDDPHRDQGVHRGGAVPRSSDGGPVERPSGPDHDRGAHGDEQPLPAGKPEPGQQREGGGPLAEGHEEQRGDQQPPAQIAHPPVVFGGVIGGAVAGSGQLRPISHRLHPLYQQLDWDLREQRNSRPLRGVIHLGAHVIKLVEAPLDLGGAGTTAHSSDRQLDLLELRRRFLNRRPRRRGAHPGRIPGLPVGPRWGWLICESGRRPTSAAPCATLHEGLSRAFTFQGEGSGNACGQRISTAVRIADSAP